MRPKREGGFPVGGAATALGAFGSDTGTVVASPGVVVSEGISCTEVGSGPATCRGTDSAGAVTAAVGVGSAKVGMGVTAAGAVAGGAATLAASIAGDSTGAEIVEPIGEDSGWR
ncbi:MAG: hypothetical protein BroJett015_16030 [Chloroflexota bacterium]|nr:hypothetical protein [Chloroflexota bacterium]GIK55940.1 MAG: hypothetical protein BroJett015_16030 [Chloroflexota bacterium]